jgi:hypothetical protein
MATKGQQQILLGMAMKGATTTADPFGDGDERGNDNSRSPSGMTTKGATATTKRATATAKGVRATAERRPARLRLIGALYKSGTRGSVSV